MIQQRNTAIMLMHCPDNMGIVAAVTEFLHNNNGNIIDIDEYVEHRDKRFFMRVEWELERFLIPKEKISDFFQTQIAAKFGMVFNLYFSWEKPRMAIFVSKLSHCLFDILSRVQMGEWQVDVPLIISNHNDLEQIAGKFGISFYHIPITKENKNEQEAKETALLREHDVNFIVLARYMQVVTQRLIDEYQNKIINIHHSFLPAFAGAKPYHGAYDRGVKIIGATSHYVTADLDAGPIVSQDVVPVTHRDSIDDLLRKGRNLEKIVLSTAVHLHLQRRTLVYNNKTIVFV
ncbi:MAG: formyltetrahydrofolate deformylase [Bacteroidales bacterium]|nr:formyltetrahydrofolate deformylase [Bacteroidales bacterium]